MTTLDITLRERVYTAIAHQSLLVANGIYSLCEMSVEDLRWLYEQIGERYIQDIEASRIERDTISNTLDKIRNIISDIEKTGTKIDWNQEER